MKASKMLIATLKEAPNEAIISSHILLTPFYTLLFLGGLQPLCAIGETSLIKVMFSSAV